MHDIARIKPTTITGFSNGGWCADRYRDLPPLNAGTRMPVADLQGPGIIRTIHTTRHYPPDLCARGIVLEIVFDDAPTPAVLCPLADFFGDGCNGATPDFTAALIECGPGSYNAWFPMPFRRRAQVFLRNDTDHNTGGNYSFVEWERLPDWDDTLGYFHATWERRAFQLTSATCETTLALHGSGHLLGRQYSIITDEPHFRGMYFVVEGNNEVDIDGDERRIDYLGTEDSFGFSWGFQRRFAGLRNGMPLAEMGDTSRVSMYRFHDTAPLRFNRSLTWRINWQQERLYNDNPDFKAKQADAQARDGNWVDYAMAHYWYSTDPAGQAHQPLPPVAERMKPLLHSCRPAPEKIPNAAG